MSISRKKPAKLKSVASYSKRGTKNGRETDDLLQQLTGGPLNLSRALRSIRLSEEVSQAEFARRLGIPRQHLNDIEKGRRSIGLEKAAAFAKILGESEAVFVQLALQSFVDEAGLALKVEVAP
jgi:DNA-binding transcriptional regulator YiaG